MAYCKWSDATPLSDLIAFERPNGGYTAMVRSKRRIRPIPTLDLSSTPAKFESLRRRKEAEADPANPVVPLGLPLAGKTLHFDTLEEMHEQILAMRHDGYLVPDEAVDQIQEDILLNAVALEIK